MEETSKEIEDPVTHEIITETELIGTGKFSIEKYKEKNKDKFEKKVIELLNTYNRSEIIPIALEEYDVDLLWNSDNV